MSRAPNESWHLTPGWPLLVFWSPLARRGCTLRYMPRTLGKKLFLGFTVLLLCPVWGADGPKVNPIETQAQAGPPSGTFVSGSRSTSREQPFFTLHLETNGTYLVQCAIADIVPDINGGAPYSYPGIEKGTWLWKPAQHELFFTSTNSSHMPRDKSLREAVMLGMSTNDVPSGPFDFPHVLRTRTNELGALELAVPGSRWAWLVFHTRQ